MLVDGVIERESASLDLLEHERRREELADGGGTEEGGGRHALAAGEVGVAEAVRETDAVAVESGDGGADDIGAAALGLDEGREDGWDSGGGVNRSRHSHLFLLKDPKTLDATYSIVFFAADCDSGHNLREHAARSTVVAS